MRANSHDLQLPVPSKGEPEKGVAGEEEKSGDNGDIRQLAVRLDVIRQALGEGQVVNPNLVLIQMCGGDL